MTRQASRRATRRGGIAAHYEHAPFGSITASTRSTSVTAYDFRTYNPFRFSSEYADDALGLVYYNYRHYNPLSGRWTSRDLIAEIGGINLYGFVGNMAFARFDYLGLDDDSCITPGSMRGAPNIVITTRSSVYPGSKLDKEANELLNSFAKMEYVLAAQAIITSGGLAAAVWAGTEAWAGHEMAPGASSYMQGLTNIISRLSNTFPELVGFGTYEICECVNGSYRFVTHHVPDPSKERNIDPATKRGKTDELASLEFVEDPLINVQAYRDKLEDFRKRLLQDCYNDYKEESKKQREKAWGKK